MGGEERRKEEERREVERRGGRRRGEDANVMDLCQVQ